MKMAFLPSLDDIFLESYKCVVCLNIMRPPIRDCINGHSYCYSCSLKMEICPFCRAPHTPLARISPMDLLHQYLILPCDGCRTLVLGFEFAKHLLVCLPGLMYLQPCPFNLFGYRCNWFGPDVENFPIEHVKNVHSYDFHNGPVWVRPPTFDFKGEGIRGDFFTIAYNTLFVCNVKVSRTKGFAKHREFFVSVFYGGTAEEAKHYFFKATAYVVCEDSKTVIEKPCRTAFDLNNKWSTCNYMYSAYMGENIGCDCIDLKIEIIKGYSST